MRLLMMTNGYATISIIVEQDDVENAISKNFNLGWCCLSYSSTGIVSCVLAMQVNTLAKHYGMFIPESVNPSLSGDELEQYLITTGHIA